MGLGGEATAIVLLNGYLVLIELFSKHLCAHNITAFCLGQENFSCSGLWLVKVLRMSEQCCNSVVQLLRPTW